MLSRGAPVLGVGDVVDLLKVVSSKKRVCFSEILVNIAAAICYELQCCGDSMLVVLHLSPVRYQLVPFDPFPWVAGLWLCVVQSCTLP